MFTGRFSDAKHIHKNLIVNNKYCHLKTLIESVHYPENLHKLYRILLIADCNLGLEKIIRSTFVRTDDWW